MNNPYLYPGLRLGPMAIERIVQKIDASRYDQRTDPDRFSLREAVAHLADWEPILLGRMKMAVDAPGSTISGIDEGQRSIAQGYNSKDPVQEALRYRELREETIRFLQARSPEDWSKTVIHSERGLQTLEDQASLLLGHDHYHLEHLTQYL
jgi:hypothetical protein